MQQGGDEQRLGGSLQGAADDFGLPEPLPHIVADVHRLYESRTLDDLVTVLRRRYREDATFIDPTLAARPRTSVGLQFFALQHLFSNVRISDVRIGQPEVHLAPQTKGQQPGLVEVVVRSTQEYHWGRTNHISRQIFPEHTTLEATTTLLLDPRTALVVSHADSWDNKSFKLPMAWRRLNALSTNVVYRCLGWRSALLRAEQKCAEAEAEAGSRDQGNGAGQGGTLSTLG